MNVLTVDMSDCLRDRLALDGGVNIFLVTSIASIVRGRAGYPWGHQHDVRSSLVSSAKTSSASRLEGYKKQSLL